MKIEGFGKAAENSRKVDLGGRLEMGGEGGWGFVFSCRRDRLIGAFALVARHPEATDPRVKMAVTTSRQTNVAEIVGYLQEHLGREVTGYVCGIEPEEMEIVGRWAAGDAEPEPLSFGRLEAAYEATRRILPFYDGKTAQSWFFGSWMRGKAPAHVLRYSSNSETWGQVVNAAEEFVELTR